MTDRSNELNGGRSIRAPVSSALCGHCHSRQLPQCNIKKPPFYLFWRDRSDYYEQEDHSHLVVEGLAVEVGKV